MKLVNFEFNRFFKVYLALIGITILSQLIGVFYEAGNYVSKANHSIYNQLMSKSDFITQYQPMSLVRIIIGTPWFIGPIVFSVAVLLIYVFFIWYRDWLGKNTFSYRLLMLPTARINIYLAKATTILLFVFGLVALQLLLFISECWILQWMVPNEFRIDNSITEIINSEYLFRVLFPRSFLEFLLTYAIGITAVFMIFTAILFERSYRIKGIIFGIIYVFLSIVIFFVPILLQVFIFKNYFYPVELFFMEVVTGLIVLTGAIWIGNYLIKNKVMA